MTMQNTPNSRKRPAPGTSPMDQKPVMPQQPYQYQQPPPNTDFSNFDFSAPLQNEQTYPIPSNFDANNFSYGLNNAQATAYGSNLPPAQSNELVRRTRNQQLAPQNDQQEQWGGYASVSAQVEDEDEQDLDVRVALAKKDAQGKRKQIPPFVQKLSSFLDSSHTELIRWSDDGRSFIVLDEDEFARTLIPELFKHNNYASFVRQLNMYGFHKTVNITDGSLRQSEKARKGVKPPSMYSHPYFRRNRPDLLWLIQKPTTKPSGKRKREDDVKGQYDSDDERQFSPPAKGKPQQLSGPGQAGEIAQLPRNELAAVRQELQKLQTSQRYISEMISHLKQQNDQFYRQASAFQALHDRHENSINAILTFLATFYNRSLESQGAQNLVNMFTNAAQNQQHGSVVEEFNDGGTPTPSNQVQKYVRRPPLLLPGPESNNHSLQPGSATTQPSSARESASPPNGWANRGSTSSAPPDSAHPQSATTSASPAIKDDAPTPDVLQQVPESSDQMMNLINNVNATSGATAPNTTAPAFDLNTIVDQYNSQNGNPLTPQQRQNMVDAVMKQGGDSSAYNNSSALTAGQSQPFDMDQLKQSQNTLEMLQGLQKRQDAKVQELSQRLQPLSPTGTIPGLAGMSDQDPFDSIGAPGDYDPNAFINFGDDTWDPGNGDSGDFDFGFDNSGNAGTNYDSNWTNFDGGDGSDMFGADNDGPKNLAPNNGTGQGGRVESVSSEATSPAGDDPGTPRKRTRRS